MVVKTERGICSLLLSLIMHILNNDNDDNDILSTDNSLTYVSWCQYRRPRLWKQKDGIICYQK